jgi:hypothetical protein
MTSRREKLDEILEIFGDGDYPVMQVLSVRDSIVNSSSLDDDTRTEVLESFDKLINDYKESNLVDNLLAVTDTFVKKYDPSLIEKNMTVLETYSGIQGIGYIVNEIKDQEMFKYYDGEISLDGMLDGLVIPEVVNTITTFCENVHLESVIRSITKITLISEDINVIKPLVETIKLYSELKDVDDLASHLSFVLDHSGPSTAIKTAHSFSLPEVSKLLLKAQRATSYDKICQIIETTIDYSNNDSTVTLVAEVVDAYLTDIGTLDGMMNSFSYTEDESNFIDLTTDLKTCLYGEHHTIAIEAMHNIGLSPSYFDNSLNYVAKTFAAYINSLKLSEIIELTKELGWKAGSKGFKEPMEILRKCPDLYNLNKDSLIVYSMDLAEGIEDYELASSLHLKEVNKLVHTYQLLKTTVSDWKNTYQTRAIGSFFKTLNAKVAKGQSLQDKRTILMEWSTNTCQLIRNNLRDLKYAELTSPPEQLMRGVNAA